MTKLTIDIPDNIQLDEHTAKMMLAGKLYEQEKLSLQEAANYTGLSQEAFLKELVKQAEEPLRKDWENLAFQTLAERLKNEPDYGDVPLKEKNPNFVPPDKS